MKINISKKLVVIACAIIGLIIVGRFGLSSFIEAGYDTSYREAAVINGEARVQADIQNLPKWVVQMIDESVEYAKVFVTLWTIGVVLLTRWLVRKYDSDKSVETPVSPPPIPAQA